MSVHRGHHRCRLRCTTILYTLYIDMSLFYYYLVYTHGRRFCGGGGGAAQEEGDRLPWRGGPMAAASFPIPAKG